MQSPVETWLAGRDWQAFDFQREVWQAISQGRSGMLHATTGSGKTYAVWLGMLGKLLDDHPPSRGAEPLRAIWLTPMRALAADTTRALAEPLRALAPEWTIGQRTGDTPSSERARQDRRFPTVLVTTPESLSLMLTRANAREELQSVEYVIVDEWHELIGSKRGVQAQLGIARLWQFNAKLIAWGLSATLGNLREAMEVLCQPGIAKGDVPDPALVRGRIDKSLVIDTLIPTDPGKYSWAGHLGAQMQKPVVEEIAKSGTTLVFTNVRSQAEIWYQLLLEAKPEWAGEIALHHGSMDKATREWVEQGLKAGTLRAVVATSSPDLGVDYLPVERVLQIGSAKGVARMMQRAGRSGHAPGRSSRLTLV
ncbi:MAG: DEAD/DEAH box helicase, partial [Ramlibacter sp.]|nr:DEAD/DEAH box helicase [Ramlibacter sp.]